MPMQVTCSRCGRDDDESKIRDVGSRKVHVPGCPPRTCPECDDRDGPCWAFRCHLSYFGRPQPSATLQAIVASQAATTTRRYSRPGRPKQPLTLE